MRNIAYDEGLQTLLAQYATQDSADELLARIRINRQIQNQSRFFSQADNIIVYSPEGVAIGNKYAVDSQVVQHIQSLLQVVQDHGNILWLFEPGQSLQSDGVTCILITEIRASQSYAGAKLNDLLGYLVVQYNFGDIQRTLETEQEGYDAHLVNISGQILSTSSPERMEGRSPLTMPLKLDEVFTLTLRGELYYAAAQKIELPAVSLYCVCTAPMLKILEDVLVAILSILIFSVMLMICTYFVIWRRARRICGAFEEMNRSFGLIEEGKLTVDAIPPTGVEEVDHLTARFSHMADRAGSEGEETALVSQVLAYINGHYAEEITLDHLAQRFYVSKYHLSHEFSRVVGSGVYRYILLRRLLMDRELLLQGTPPGETSLRCGFQEYSNFYRAFRGYYGVSPRAYTMGKGFSE